MTTRLLRCCLGLATIGLLLGPLASSKMSARSDDRERGEHERGEHSRIKHVFVIVLENEGFDTTFGPQSKAPYLSQTLTKAGVLLTQYYGTGHASLDNYIPMVRRLVTAACTPTPSRRCRIS